MKPQVVLALETIPAIHILSVSQNVLSMQSVQDTVLILVREYVDIMLHALLQIMFLNVDVIQVTQEMLLQLATV